MTNNRNRTLIFIIILLLITNITLVVILLNKNKMPVKKGDSGFISMLKNRVGFTDNQVDRFKKFKDNYWMPAKKSADEITNIRMAIYDQTATGHPDDSIVNALLDSVNVLQKQVDKNMFYHTKGLREICEPAQRPAFDSVMREMILRPQQKDAGKDKK